MSGRSGLTLVELLVVLAVLGLTAALVAPSLILPEPADSSPVEALLERAVELAVAREEGMRLVVEADGAWRLVGGDASGAVAEGRLPAPPPAGFSLLVSPLGTCGPVPGETPPFELDALTCRPRGTGS